jgi:hypothetical protein
MEVAKPPSINVAPGGNPAPSAQSRSANPAPPLPPALDRADIGPLDVPAALQILIAEVQDAWQLAPTAATAQTPVQSPLEAAMRLVQTLLQSLPNTGGDARGWTTALAVLQAGLDTGIDRAIATVAAWRDVPQAAVDALKDARSMVAAALGDETLSPWLVPPEWAGLAPRLEIFRRRRRTARRRLIDPDFPLPELGDEPKP